MGAAAGGLLWGWRRLVRVEVRGLGRLAAHPRAPLALWHGRIHGCVYGIAPHGRFAAMFSRSADGELAAWALRPFGIGAARGSTGKGGRRALEEMVALVERGEIDHPALTVDGPRGPARLVKPGIVDLARALGTPVLPVSFSASRVWVLRSWDRMVLARPLSRVVVALGEPVTVGSGEPAEEAAARVAAVLDGLTDTLDRELHGAPLWAPPAAPGQA